ncbi:MAG TPA: sulfatase-like hydrolase/transferase [Thermoanaerobaculia bacterium]|nr:sulfatase-like hydrolase/transferase [Thermoanaerobaculia bacterium]
MLLVLVAMFLSCRHEQPAALDEHAPVILISIDTLRADHLPAYGYTKVETPHLDAFRRDAILFDNAYSHCPMTLPSHVSMLTGLLPTEHGVRNNLGYHFDATQHTTLPQMLKSRGYATGAAVSSYVLRADTGLGSAFDFYDDAIPVATSGAASQHQRPGETTLHVARSWISQHTAQPFFFFFHIYEPHAPYTPPEPYRTRYASEPYDGEIAHADAIVGEMLSFLKSSGLYDRAMIVIVSDHGEGLWQHGEDQHGILLYREVLHVPMLIKLPKNARAGERVAAPVALADLPATIAQGAGVLAPQKADRRIYSETFYPRIHLGWSELRSLVDAKQHYIQSPRSELYDVARDPQETKDILVDERRVAASMRTDLEKYPSGIQELQQIDPEDAKKLAALGYLGSVHASSSDAALPNPKDMLPYLDRIKNGFRLADERKFAEAVTVLRGLVKENPGLFDVWDKLGEVLVDMGQYDDAIEVYRTAMTRTQRFSPEMALSLGDAYLQAGKYDDAARYADLAMKSSPAPAHSLLARIAIERRDYATAEREATEAIGPSPQPAAMLLLADIYRGRNDLPRALAATEAAAQRARELGVPKLYRVDFLRGDIYARMDRPADAVAAYQREIANFPENTQAYANLAIIEFIEGRTAEVDRTLDAMVKANPHPGARALAARTRRELR